MSPKKRIGIVFAVLLVFAMVLTSCGPKATPAPVEPTAVPEAEAPTAAPEAEGEPTAVTEEEEPTAPPEEVAKVVRVNLTSYPDIIDPQKSSFVNEIGHLMLIYEGLTRLDENLEAQPGAAESWEYNDDATQLTFTLREGLTYSDGTPLNAMRFQYALLRNIDPETAGEYAYITDSILGAADWRSAEDDEAIAEAEELVRDSIKALTLDGEACEGYDDTDCRVLEFTLGEPAPYFHSIMGLWVAFPAKEELIAEGGENWWNSSRYQIGNGTHVLTELEPFVSGYFVPNENYWRGLANVDVEFSYITDSAIAFQAYNNDEFDIIPLAAEDLPTVENDPQLSDEAMIYAGSCTFGVLFHLNKEPFSDPLVRQAFTLALDREAWVEDVLQGLGAPTLTWIPPGFPGYDEDEDRWAFDPDAAVEALEASSYGSADKLPDVVLTYADTPRNRVRYEWLAAQWQDVLGVTIELNPVEPTTYTALTKDIDTAPQLFILGWCADYPDPRNWLSDYWMTGAQATNMVGYTNPEIDALLQEADQLVDRDAADKLYDEAQKLLVEELPAAFFWNNVNAFLVKPWVTSILKTPMDIAFPGTYAAMEMDVDPSLVP